MITPFSPLGMPGDSAEAGARAGGPRPEAGLSGGAGAEPPQVQLDLFGHSGFTSIARGPTSAFSEATVPAPADVEQSRGSGARRSPRPRNVHAREGRLDPYWDWSRTTREMPINKDRSAEPGEVVRASKESRELFAQRLFDDGVFTSFKQKYKFLNCALDWKAFTDGDHEWWTPFGTCGLEPCSVCAIHRERERARKACRGMGGFGTVLTGVFTLPEECVDLVNSVRAQVALESLCTWVLERHILMREGLEGHGWKIGARWDWDLSGDKSPGRYRPHINGTIPAYLHRLVDGRHELRTFDPFLDVDKLRNLYRLSLSLFFGRRIETVNLWTKYAKIVEQKRHWLRYGVMHVTDELTYDGMTKEEMDRTVDPRLWTLQRRGRMTGWMAARKGWSVEEIRIAAAKLSYWKDVVLEPSFQAVKGGKFGPETRELELWNAFAAGDPDAAAELRIRCGLNAASPLRPEGAVISTTLLTSHDQHSRTRSAESVREPGQDEELEGIPIKAVGYCPICGRPAVFARRYTEEMRPPLSRLRNGVYVRTEMLSKYREEIAVRRRQKDERRDAARLHRIEKKAAKAASSAS